jgi:hypothetical protein
VVELVVVVEFETREVMVVVELETEVTEVDEV